MTELKTTQVDGKKYDLPAEEVEIEKLIRKALAMDARIREQKEELEKIKQRLTEIAAQRRDGQTTVKLKAISGQAAVTFRESWECPRNPENLQTELGSMFDRFFAFFPQWKTGKDLKQFMDGGNDFGFPNPAALRTRMSLYVEKKTVKPNVKLVPVL
ncbi:MAG: hypothetical protein R2941_25600 [Desulfobacterales bacterium]